MRKYKGYSKAENKLYDLLAVNFTEMTALVNIEGYNNAKWCKFDEFIQYTGVNDKNDVEIYQGAILQAEWNECVVWSEEHLGWFIERDGVLDEPLFGQNSILEVIGHKLTNPELVGESK